MIEEKYKMGTHDEPTGIAIIYADISENGGKRYTAASIYIHPFCILNINDDEKPELNINSSSQFIYTENEEIIIENAEVREADLIFLGKHPDTDEIMNIISQAEQEYIDNYIDKMIEINQENSDSGPNLGLVNEIYKIGEGLDKN
jgi:hypothetical protein